MQDDFALDIHGEFTKHLKTGTDVETATRAVLTSFAESLQDGSEAPVIWQVIAKAQWTYGVLSADVLRRFREDIRMGAGKDRWREEGLKVLAKRQQVLRRFLETIERPNPRPKKRPRLTIRAPKFAAGDGLAIRLPDSRYTAAIVLAADHSNPEYRRNLIAELNFLSESPPDLEVFKRRPWLKLTHRGQATPAFGQERPWRIVPESGRWSTTPGQDRPFPRPETLASTKASSS